MAAGRELQLLIRFGTITRGELEAMRPGDVLNLAGDLHNYIGRLPTPEIRAAERGKGMALWPAIEAAGRLVAAVAHRKAGKTEPVAITGVRLDARELRRARTPEGPDRPAWSFMVEGLRDALICQAWHDLTSSSETYRVDVCALASCGRIYFADRKDQTYCSHACATKKAVREHQRRQREKAAKQSA